MQLTFDAVAWCETFDGIWACASLLHVPRADLPAALARLRKALRPQGVLYASMKRGETERTVGGRSFTDVTIRGLSELLAGQGMLVVEAWETADARPDRKEV